MNYQEAMQYIYSTSWMGSVLGLSRMRALTDRLGAPQNRIPHIHIAGTNGKGSTAAVLAQILQDAGYKTGLYTSPAIRSFEERIRIDGQPISQEDIVRLTKTMKQAAATMSSPPTEYELITTLAFLYFYDQKVDFAVTEVGLGGRIDATNVIDNPIVSVITPVALDHTKELGSDLAEVARQKAGIIKEGRPVVTASQSPVVMAEIDRICRERHCRLYHSDRVAVRGVESGPGGQVFTRGTGGTYRLALLGPHQLQNAATAMTAIGVLRDEGHAVPERAVESGLANVRWPGRFEMLRDTPPVVLDGAHNPHGAKALIDALGTVFPGRNVRFIIGVLADKVYNEIIEILSARAAGWICVTPKSERALPAEDLAAAIRSFGEPATIAADVSEALHLAMAQSHPNDVICICGTLSLIDEATTAAASL